MRDLSITLKIFDPAEPVSLAPNSGKLDCSSTGTPSFVGFDLAPEPDKTISTAVKAQSASAFRQPLRDRLRARIIDAVLSASPVPVSTADVTAALADVEGERPLLDWLTNGGFEKLVELILLLLKLAV